MLDAFKEYVGRLTGHADKIHKLQEVVNRLEEDLADANAQARRASERAERASDRADKAGKANAGLSGTLAFTKRRMEALDGLVMRSDPSGAAGYIKSLENAIRKSSKHLTTPKGFADTEYSIDHRLIRFGIQKQEFAIQLSQDCPTEEAIQFMRERFMDKIAPEVWSEIEHQVFREKDKVA